MTSKSDKIWLIFCGISLLIAIPTTTYAYAINKDWRFWYERIKTEVTIKDLPELVEAIKKVIPENNSVQK